MTESNEILGRQNNYTEALRLHPVGNIEQRHKGKVAK